MAMSEKVEEHLREAEASLRNALSYAARTEKPMVTSSIADVIGKNKSPLTKYWGLSWTELFVGVAILAHIVTIYVLIGSA